MRYLGAAFYPELLAPDEWETELARMRKAGLNLVRLAEAAWLSLETEEGRFTFEWLDEVLELCVRHELAVVLGTPTFVPPNWLSESHPEIVLTNRHGKKAGTGGRQHHCLHSEQFVQATRRIVGALAERYGHHEAVVGWQIGNEFGHTTCYCDRCGAAFAEWLRHRYGTIERLNEAWANGVWGHSYTAFERVRLPSDANEPQEGKHPLALTLAHRRFRSDATSRYVGIQLELLRALTAGSWISTNGMGLYTDVDVHRLFAPLDIAAWDNYPPLNGWQRTSLAHGLNRAMKPRPHWVLEQVCGQIGDSETVWAGQPARGEIQRWVLHSYAHGAESVSFWPWRSLPGGNWTHWQGLVTVGGHETPRLDEVRELSSDLARLDEGLSTHTREARTAGRPPTRIAIAISYDNWWTLIHDTGAPGFTVDEVMKDWVTGAAGLGVQVDMVTPDAALATYPVVIFPALSLVDSDVSALVDSVTGSGGVVVLPPRTGRYMTDGALSHEVLPGPVRAASGIRVRDYDVIPEGTSLELVGGIESTGRWWLDLVEPAEADVVATVSSGRHSGGPAVTWNRWQAGGVVYLATYLDPGGCRDVLTLALASTGREAGWALPDGCELVAREDGLLCVFNHTDEERSFRLARPFTDVRTSARREGLIRLRPQEVLALVDTETETTEADGRPGRG